MGDISRRKKFYQSQVVGNFSNFCEGVKYMDQNAINVRARARTRVYIKYTYIDECFPFLTIFSINKWRYITKTQFLIARVKIMDII